jgi:hypothetical protein
MPQGKTKGLQAKSASSHQAKRAAQNTKKGKRYIAPKKALLVKQAEMKKVNSVVPVKVEWILMRTFVIDSFD